MAFQCIDSRTGGAFVRASWMAAIKLSSTPEVMVILRALRCTERRRSRSGDRSGSHRPRLDFRVQDRVVRLRKIVEMARCAPAVVYWPKGRVFLPAAIERKRASRMETTTTWWVHGTRHVAFKNHTFPRGSRFGYRYS